MSNVEQKLEALQGQEAHLCGGSIGELVSGKLNQYKAGYFSVTNQEDGEQFVFSLPEVNNVMDNCITIWM